MTKTVSESRLELKDTSSQEPLEVKLYPIRWIILVLYVIYSASNSMQWIEYVTVENVIKRFYGVSSLWVEMTGVIFGAFYAILLFPVCYFLNRGYLRLVCLSAVFLTCLGSWIKVFSASPDRFCITFVGQCLIASSQVVIITATPDLAHQWFGTSEIATATALGVLGVPVGIASFSPILPLLIQDHVNLEKIVEDIYAVFLGVAIFCTCIAAGMFMFFRKEPKICPSEARALQKIYQRDQPTLLWKSLLRILKDKHFLLLWISHGVCLGALNALTIILNVLCLARFETGAQDAGICNMCISVGGIIASPIFAKIIDRTKRFKLLLVSLYIFSAFSVAAFSITLIYSNTQWLVYLSSALVGMSTGSYLIASFEVCAEVTYPESLGVTVPIMIVANQIVGVVFAVTMNLILNKFGDELAHLYLCIIVGSGIIVTIIIDPKNRRLKAASTLSNTIIPVPENAYSNNGYM